MVNNASFRVFTQDISLEINLRIGSYGRWDTPIVPEITSSSIMISVFTADLADSYSFYATNYLNTDTVAIQINLSATGKIYLQKCCLYFCLFIISFLGSNFAELTSSNEYTLLSGNNIFSTDTTLVCVTTDTSIQPVWTYRETQHVVDTTLTGVNWDDSTGISRLDIVTTQQGYYTCTTTGVQSYNVAIFNPDVTTSELMNLFEVLIIILCPQNRTRNF